MRKSVLIALMAGSALLAQGPRGGWGGFGGHEAESLIRGAAVTGAPFSAVQVTTHQQTLANGNVIQKQEQTSLYRDSQGRVREETTWTGPNAESGRTMVTISDPVAQVVRRLNSQSKTAFETPLRQTAAGRASERAARGHAHHAGSADVVTEDLGTQTMNGVAATGTRFTRTIAAGAMGNAQPIQVVREVWSSSDLKIPVMVKVTDPRFGTTTTQLTSINRAEPEAALFQTPAGYTVTQGHGRGFGGAQAQ
jgi:hypothetical protein